MSDMYNAMEQYTETIDLDLDESNDLTFKIRLEGAASSPAKVRLVCEDDKYAYMFSGYGTGEDDVVQFTLPQMSNRIQEGVYPARVEVLVENRYFVPLQFQVNFKRSLNVVAESFQATPKSDFKVTTAQRLVKKAAPTNAVRFEQRPAMPPAVFEQKVQVEPRPESQIVVESAPEVPVAVVAKPAAAAPRVVEQKIEAPKKPVAPVAKPVVSAKPTLKDLYMKKAGSSGGRF